DIASMLDADLITVTATVTDGDDDTADLTVSIADQLDFYDDGPSIERSSDAVPTLSVDESDLTADDTSHNIAGLFDISAGADGEKSVVYTLDVSADGADSGLVDTATGEAVLLRVNGDGDVEGYTETSNDIVFVLSVAANGDLELDQQRAIIHADETDDNDIASMLDADLITVTATVTDGDDDTADLTVSIADQLDFYDDGPTLGLYGDAAAVPGFETTQWTGDFVYDVGADQRTTYDATHTDLAVLISGSVGGLSVTDTDVSWSSEDADEAVFDFLFTYQPNPADDTLTQQATGTITFDKVAGTYTVALDEPIQSYNIVTTSGTISKESFNFDGSSDAQPEVVLSKLDDHFYVRFSAGVEAPGASVTFKTTGNDTSYVDGDTFTGTQSWVSVTGASNGVAGDTLQAGEVLNMDFAYDTIQAVDIANPVTEANRAYADGIYIKVDQLGVGEDMVVVLKLVDGDGAETTRSIVVDYEDIWLSSETNPYGITFADGSDGVIIIESNDYNFGGEDYRIYGAQLLVSTETVTNVDNLAINLDRDTGVASTSTDNAEAFSVANGTVDNDVIKVVDIGFVQIDTETSDLELSLAVTVTDADGDSTTTTNLAIVTPVALDMDHDGQVSYVGLEAGVHYDYAGDGVAESTAWVAGNDGLLALRNEDGSFKISFATHEGQTDLEGLAQVYDSNQDGVLDANDAAFAGFGVWQDANQDGVVDAGEFQSLTEEGIASLALVSDGQVATAADGDVIIFGTSSYTTENGNTYAVDDVGFTTVTTTATNDNVELEKTSINGSISNALLAASLIAMVESDDSNAQPVATEEQTVEQHPVTVETTTASTDDVTTEQASADIDGKLLTGLDVSAEHAEAHAPVSSGEDHPALSGLDVAADTDAAPVIAELLSDTDISPSIFHFAQSVSIDAPSTVAVEAVLIQQAAAPAQIGDVLADALSGGSGEGPNIDHVLDLLTGSTGQADAGALLSSLGSEAGAIADMFAGAHLNFADTMDHLAMTHPDAHTSVMG
ncbi:DUF5801 repeats-in-toxin domain-containing protein, partial [Aquisediminimonas sediminicola]|uniref:DUF5801 repeats-in-toxin domain-containing protein n=1 Tax=Alteraquisediminimonas sediminicola TaxID=2676787 RepID=UPI001C8D22CA